MAEQTIEVRAVREFGENLSDTFLFIRQNFPSLIKSFLAICAVFMLIQAICTGMYQSKSIGILTGIFKGKQQNGVNPFSQIFSVEYLLVILTALLTFVAMNVALGAYVKCYAQNDERKPSIEDVWDVFRQYFFRVFIYSLPIYLMVIVGCFFCLVPGIYLWVVFVPFTLVIMVEKKSFSEAFGRCFDLIRDNFWSSFAIYLVSFLIYYFSGFIVGGILSAVIGLAGYLTTDNIANSYAVASSFLNIFSYCFYLIFFISASLNYFSLAEMKDGTGILNRIDSIGKNKSSLDNAGEEY